MLMKIKPIERQRFFFIFGCERDVPKLFIKSQSWKFHASTAYSMLYLRSVTSCD